MFVKLGASWWFLMSPNNVQSSNKLLLGETETCGLLVSKRVECEQVIIFLCFAFSAELNMSFGSTW